MQSTKYDIDYSVVNEVNSHMICWNHIVMTMSLLFFHSKQGYRIFLELGDTNMVVQNRLEWQRTF